MIKNKKVRQLIPILIMLLVIFVFNNNDERNQIKSIESVESIQLTKSTETIENLYKSKASGVLITFNAKVENILSDDNEDSRHQRIILKTNNRTVLLAHNIDVAPRVPVNKNDRITVKGEYEWNQKGGIVHWTHKKDNRPYGWVLFNNKKYQ